MNKSLIVVLSILVVAVAGWQLIPERKSSNIVIKNGPIVALGASLVVGVGAPADEGFVDLLSDRIGEPILNAGISGQTSAEALARLDDVLALEPRLTIVQLGGNDALQNVPRAETMQNIEEIITRLQDSGSAIVLLGVRRGLLQDQARSDFDQLARDLHLRNAYVPNILDGLFGNPLLMSDPIHPNALGYAVIAERVEPVLVSVLE
jgi:lysophospholipase L1-like esterase